MAVSVHRMELKPRFILGSCFYGGGRSVYWPKPTIIKKLLRRNPHKQAKYGYSFDTLLWGV